MNIQNIQLDDGEIRFIECKFTVEGDEMLGGDYEKNYGGMRKKSRISFEGCCSKEMYDVLADSIKKVVGE